jgi:uncharacterized repeat protein (TIGR01451 family)
MTHRFALAAMFVFSTMIAVPALGAGTLAGTSITNQAQVSFNMGGSSMSQLSNVAAVAVAEIIDVNLVVQTPQRLVYSGATGQPLRLTLTNIGNGDESFNLASAHSIAGDDFDPVASTPAIYLDSDGDGILGAADQVYQPGLNDPLLVPDASIGVFLVSDIPAGLADSDFGLAELSVSANSGSGVPGQNLAGQGNGGLDAIIGLSGAAVAAAGEYLIGRVSLTLAKSATVSDQNGGSSAVRGALIDYKIQVSASGSGRATDAVFVDAIPVGTRFEPGSIRVNGIVLSDAIDGDSGFFDPLPASVRVNLGSLGPADPAQQISFSVRID